MDHDPQLRPNPMPDVFAGYRRGDDAARDELFRRVYGELRKIALATMAGQPKDRTLGPTVLVHEAFLRLDRRPEACTDHNHFLAVAALAMRQILIDYVKRRQRYQRVVGAGDDRIALDAVVASYEERAIELISLDRALDELSKVDPRGAQLVQLHFFGGQTMTVCAAVLGISERQVYRDWNHARAFLHRALATDSASPDR